MHRYLLNNVSGTCTQQPRQNMRWTLAGWGYHPTRRMLRKLALQQTAEQKRETILTRGELNPQHSSAAQSLRTLELSLSTDFDDGVRTLKRGMRDATIADGVAEEIQNAALQEHNLKTRGRLNELPPEIKDTLGNNWRMLPHAFEGNLRHMRGSFLGVTKAVDSLIQTNAKKTAC